MQRWKWMLSLVTVGLTLGLPPPMWDRLVNDTAPFRRPGHLGGAPAHRPRSHRVLRVVCSKMTETANKSNC